MSQANPSARRGALLALGVAVGSGYLYETTFEKEVYSDLYGERGVVRVIFPPPSLMTQLTVVCS